MRPPFDNFIKWLKVTFSGELWMELGKTAPFSVISGDNYYIFMLLGEYQHNLDSKGRIAIPAKFKEKLTSGAIITRGLDNCLFVFASKEWETLAGKLIALPLAQANSRAFSRLMLAGAMDAALDGQGRILIPDYLRQYAGLKKQVIVAGLYNRVEIWDMEKWQEYKKKTESASDEIAEKLGELGI